MDTDNTIRREFTVDADAATVFAFFTEPQRLIRWIGISAELDPRPGGIMLVDVMSGWMAHGEFKEVVPVSRLTYTWGWEGNNHFVAPGSSLIEVDLLPKNGSTLVRFTHSGLPPEAGPAIARDGRTTWGVWRLPSSAPTLVRIRGSIAPPAKVIYPAAAVSIDALSGVATFGDLVIERLCLTIRLKQRCRQPRL